MIIQGIAQVLSSLAVVEISPDGYEASVQLGTDAAAIGKSYYCKMLQELDCTQNCMADTVLACLLEVLKPHLHLIEWVRFSTAVPKFQDHL